MIVKSNYINGTNKRYSYVDLWSNGNHKDLDMTITIHGGFAISELIRSYQYYIDVGRYKGDIPPNEILLEEWIDVHQATEI